MHDRFVYLASRSPRRRELLAQIGVRFELIRADVDESPRAGEDAVEHVLRLAVAKASTGRARLGSRPPAPVLGADTAVVLDGEVLGKPSDEAQALAMLARLGGRAHEVATAVAVANGARVDTRVSVTRVWMRSLSAAEARSYWASGEPRDKAGAYAIQGRAAAFVTRIEGSYSGVVGLPLYETAELLAAAGLRFGDW